MNATSNQALLQLDQHGRLAVQIIKGGPYKNWAPLLKRTMVYSEFVERFVCNTACYGSSSFSTTKFNLGLCSVTFPLPRVVAAVTSALNLLIFDPYLATPLYLYCILQWFITEDAEVLSSRSLVVSSGKSCLI